MHFFLTTVDLIKYNMAMRQSADISLIHLNQTYYDHILNKFKLNFGVKVQITSN